MKNTALGLSMMMAVLSSCQESDYSITPDEGLISFQIESVSHANQFAWQQNDEIGFFTPQGGNIGYYNTAEDGSTPAFKAIDDKLVFRVGDDVTDIVAYYPYNASIEEGQYPVDVVNQADLLGVDLLLADVVNSNAQQVTLAFKQQMAMIRVNLTAGENMPSTALKDVDVTIKGMQSTGVYDFVEGAFDSLQVEEIINLPLFENENEMSNEAVIIPQETVEAMGLLYKINGKGDYTLEFPSEFESFESGKIYEINAVFDGKVISITSSNITNWTTNDTEEGDAGIYVPNPKTVGYLYYKDGTWGPASEYVANEINPAVGVIYKVGLAAGESRAVSLNEFAGPWTSEPQASMVATNAKNPDGVLNMVAVQAIDPNFESHPAFAFVHKMNASNHIYEGGQTGVWYLPIDGELKTILNLYLADEELFNSWFTMGEGQPFRPIPATGGEHYWTSKETTNQKAQYIRFTRDMKDGKLNCGPWGQFKDKATSIARAVIRF